MKTVREILLNKGKSIHSISPDDTIFNALKLMADKKIGALLVIDKDRDSRDYVGKRLCKKSCT